MRHSPKDFRRGLRRQATPEERRLWSVLRDRRLGGFKFRRQHSVGVYVLDFYCYEARLVVEVDGSVHDDPARAAYDTERERALAEEGLRVVRVSNDEVFDRLEVVAAAILAACRGENVAPHPDPLPGGEGIT